MLLILSENLRVYINQIHRFYNCKVTFSAKYNYPIDFDVTLGKLLGCYKDNLT